MQEKGFKGLIRHTLLTFAQKRSCTRKQCMCVPVSKYVFKFSAVSFCKKCTSQITFVWGCSVVISVASQRCFCEVGYQTGCRSGQAEAEDSTHSRSPGTVKVVSQGRGEVDKAPCSHSPTITPGDAATQEKKPLASAFAFLLSLVCFALSYFLPELHTNPEWARAAPPVFKHLARSLVSSFLQLIQEADKFC